MNAGPESEAVEVTKLDLPACDACCDEEARPAVYSVSITYPLEPQLGVVHELQSELQLCQVHMEELDRSLGRE